MRTVWKFELEDVPVQTVELRAGAQILSAQGQLDRMQMWALVDTALKVEPWQVCIAGTGHEIPLEAGDHIATVQVAGGSLVWHVFARPADDALWLARKMAAL